MHGEARIAQLPFVPPRCGAGHGLRRHALYSWINSLAFGTTAGTLIWSLVIGFAEDVDYQYRQVSSHSRARSAWRVSGRSVTFAIVCERRLVRSGPDQIGRSNISGGNDENARCAILG